MDSITESIKNDLSEIQANNATVYEALLAALADNRQLRAELNRMRELSHLAGNTLTRILGHLLAAQAEIEEYSRFLAINGGETDGPDTMD